jgi:hypothetical protein
MIDRKGKKYGKWKALRFLGYADKARCHPMWLCRCKCGHEQPVCVANLVSGASTQCRKCQGKEYSKTCAKRRRIRVAAMTPEYYVWRTTRRSRVTRWQRYSNFLRDMGLCPPGMTLLKLRRGEPHGPKNSYWGKRVTPEKLPWRVRAQFFTKATRKDAIREAVRRHHVGQSELARYLKISPQCISQIVNEKALRGDAS